MIKEAIAKLVELKDLSETEAATAMEELMEGKATQAQIGAFLTALRMKGETVDEIYAFAKVMREKASKLRVPENTLDTCGTGGDGCGTFNISTAAAFVAAGAGIPVAKHGNRSVSSKCGSADVLETLGMNVNLAPEQVEECIQEIGIGFLFAPVFHGAMKHALVPRKEIGIRTVFNMLGPLTNPGNLKYQLMGIYDSRLTEKLAMVLKKLGSKHALVVNGSGMDEITTLGSTIVSELKGDEVHSFSLAPEQFGFRRAKQGDLAGKNPQENAELLLSVLSGETSPHLDVVLLNAGAAIYAAGRSKDIQEGIALARKSVESGEAKRKLELLVGKSNGFGGMRNGR